MIHSDEVKYNQLQDRQCGEWEALCRCCGACCGVVEGDPCEHVFKSGDGKYACRIYENRFGLHKTKSGRPLECVPIRNILHKSWPGDQGCGYKVLACGALRFSVECKSSTFKLEQI